MHSLLKIHRDIKAGNILLDVNGNAKLADLGVAGELENSLTKRNTVIGTPFWMAPEVVEESGYDVRADIWSLGITAIEMAEGHPPLHEVHPMRAIFMIPSKPPPTLTCPEEWTPEFIEFVGFCLVKDPSTRKSATVLLESAYINQAKPPSSLSPLTQEVLAIMATGKRADSDDDSGTDGSSIGHGGGGGGIRGGDGGGSEGSTDGSDVEYIDSSTLVPGDFGTSGSVGGGGGGGAGAGAGAGEEDDEDDGEGYSTMVVGDGMGTMMVGTMVGTTVVHDPGTLVVGTGDSSVYNTGTMVNNDPNAIDPDATLAPHGAAGGGGGGGVAGGGGGGDAGKPFFMRHIEANQSAVPAPVAAKPAKKPEPNGAMSEQELETRLECLVRTTHTHRHTRTHMIYVHLLEWNRGGGDGHCYWACLSLNFAFLTTPNFGPQQQRILSLS